MCVVCVYSECRCVFSVYCAYTRSPPLAQPSPSLPLFSHLSLPHCPLLSLSLSLSLPIPLGMLSAAASIGLILLWDVEGGLTEIDKFLYSTEDYIKVMNWTHPVPHPSLFKFCFIVCRRERCWPAVWSTVVFVTSVNQPWLS